MAAAPLDLLLGVGRCKGELCGASVPGATSRQDQYRHLPATAQSFLARICGRGGGQGPAELAQGTSQALCV